MFQWTICDPLVAEVIQKGDIDKADIIDTFRSHPWREMLQKQQDAKEEDLHFSPSVEFKNTDDGSSLSIVVVGEQQGNCLFYAFYIPPGKTAAEIQQAQGLSRDGVVDVLSLFTEVHHDALSGKFQKFSGSQVAQDTIPASRILTKMALLLLILLWVMIAALFLSDTFNGTNLMSQISILSFFQGGVE